MVAPSGATIPATRSAPVIETLATSRGVANERSVAILGFSASGKSLYLAMLYFLNRSTAGEDTANADWTISFADDAQGPVTREYLDGMARDVVVNRRRPQGTRLDAPEQISLLLTRRRGIRATIRITTIDPPGELLEAFVAKKTDTLSEATRKFRERFLNVCRSSEAFLIFTNQLEVGRANEEWNLISLLELLIQENRMRPRLVVLVVTGSAHHGGNGASLESVARSRFRALRGKLADEWRIPTEVVCVDSLGRDFVTSAEAGACPNNRGESGHLCTACQRFSEEKSVQPRPVNLYGPWDAVYRRMFRADQRNPAAWWGLRIGIAVCILIGTLLIGRVIHQRYTALDSELARAEELQSVDVAKSGYEEIVAIREGVRSRWLFKRLPAFSRRLEAIDQWRMAHDAAAAVLERLPAADPVSRFDVVADFRKRFPLSPFGTVLPSEQDLFVERETFLARQENIPLLRRLTAVKSLASFAANRTLAQDLARGLQPVLQNRLLEERQRLVEFAKSPRQAFPQLSENAIWQEAQACFQILPDAVAGPGGILQQMTAQLQNVDTMRRVHKLFEGSTENLQSVGRINLSSALREEAKSLDSFLAGIVLDHAAGLHFGALAARLQWSAATATGELEATLRELRLYEELYPRAAETRDAAVALQKLTAEIASRKRDEIATADASASLLPPNQLATGPARLDALEKAAEDYRAFIRRHSESSYAHEQIERNWLAAAISEIAEIKAAAQFRALNPSALFAPDPKIIANGLSSLSDLVAAYPETKAGKEAESIRARLVVYRDELATVETLEKAVRTPPVRWKLLEVGEGARRIIDSSASADLKKRAEAVLQATRRTVTLNFAITGFAETGVFESIGPNNELATVQVFAAPSAGEARLLAVFPNLRQGKIQQKRKLTWPIAETLVVKIVIEDRRGNIAATKEHIFAYEDLPAGLSAPLNAGRFRLRFESSWEP